MSKFAHLWITWYTRGMDAKDLLIEQLTAENKTLKETVAALQETIKALEDKIARLEKNSNNSSSVCRGSHVWALMKPAITTTASCIGPGVFRRRPTAYFISIPRGAAECWKRCWARTSTD